MPGRLPYDEAMRFAKLRLKIQDPDLKQGEVAILAEQTAKGTTQRPWGIEGSFAVVYKFVRKSGKNVALRCFRGTVKPDTQFRYEKISSYFKSHAADITAGFNYYIQGVLVKESSHADEIYPIVEMEWIDGFTLHEYVDILCRNSNKMGLGKLVENWLELISAMHDANIAHGDLAGVNVMVRKDERLVLIDYDGVYIPNFAHLPTTVVGQDDYQLQQERTFGKWMDEFSFLVIYTALLALHVEPRLWNTYAARTLEGKLKEVNLLFTKDDFTDHSRPLWRDLGKISDARVKFAVQELKKACQSAVDQIRFPSTLIDHDKQAFADFEQAIKSNDDAQIIKKWTKSLEKYEPAKKYQARVEEARVNTQTLADFRAAIKSNSIQKIVSAYDPYILDHNRNVTASERELLHLANNFLSAYHQHNDVALLIAYTALQNTDIVLSAVEQQSVNEAQKIVKIIKNLKDAFASKNIQKIVKCYDSSLDTSQKISDDERMVFALARAFHNAYNGTSDVALLDAYEAIDNFEYRKQIMFTEQELKRVEQAKTRKAKVVSFRNALRGKYITQIVNAYDTTLDAHLDVSERECYTLAQKFLQACTDEDDAAILAAYEAIQKKDSQRFQFTSAENQHIELAMARKSAALRFRMALMNKKTIQEIVKAYDPILDNSKNMLLPQERERLIHVRAFQTAYLQGDDIKIADAFKQTLDSPYRSYYTFTKVEQDRIKLAQQRKAAIEKFHVAVTSKKAQKIIDAYKPEIEPSQNFTEPDREILAQARTFLVLYQAVTSGMQNSNGMSSENDSKIALLYNDELAAQFTDLSQQQLQWAKDANERGKLEYALNGKMYGLAVRSARAIEQKTGKVNPDFRLGTAKSMFINSCNPKNLQARLQGYQLFATWQWPEDELVEDVVLIWDTTDWPISPNLVSKSHMLFVRRADKDDRFFFNIGSVSQVYVQVLAAIPHKFEYSSDISWYYSNGDEPTCKVFVRR